jgi:hypothetical protein
MAARMITAFGKTQMVTEWAKEVGLPQSTLIDRLNAGWPVERALSLPPRTREPSKPRRIGPDALLRSYR